jgi:hypothetical protein
MSQRRDLRTSRRRSQGIFAQIPSLLMHSILSFLITILVGMFLVPSLTSALLVLTTAAGILPTQYLSQLLISYARKMPARKAHPRLTLSASRTHADHRVQDESPVSHFPRSTDGGGPKHQHSLLSLLLHQRRLSGRQAISLHL